MPRIVCQDKHPRELLNLLAAEERVLVCAAAARHHRALPSGQDRKVFLFPTSRRDSPGSLLQPVPPCRRCPRELLGPPYRLRYAGRNDGSPAGKDQIMDKMSARRSDAAVALALLLLLLSILFTSGGADPDARAEAGALPDTVCAAGTGQEFALSTDVFPPGIITFVGEAQAMIARGIA